MAVLHHPHHQKEMAAKFNNRAYSIIRYALYVFFLFASTQAYAGSNPTLKFFISLFLIFIAEKLFKSKYYVLFGLIMIDRLMVSSIDLTEFFYTIYEPTTVYYFMVDLFNYQRIFYLVATHMSFTYLIAKEREPNFLYPIIATSLIYYVSVIVPDMNDMIFYFLYSYGIIAFILMVFLVNRIYEIFDTKVIALSVIYFIYSFLLLIKHMNQTGNYLTNFNMSYAFPVVLLLATIVVLGNGWVVQNLLNKKFVIGLISLSVFLAINSYGDRSEFTQHIVFITLVFFTTKVFHDIRENAFKQYS